MEQGISQAILRPMAAVSQPTQLSGLRIEPANAGDHGLVFSLLRAVQQAPSQADFAFSLDRPNYEPTDRLLLKFNEQIVGHVQLVYQEARFGGIKAPMVCLRDFAVLPEFVQAGYEDLLL